MSKKILTNEALAAAGVYVEAPQIEVADNQAAVDPIGLDADFAQLAADEKFLHEIVKIRIATTTDPNAPPFATVTVNDINNRVRIPRGVVVPVKRCQVEILARMRETRYQQPPRNPMDPESGNMLIPQHAQVYPFEVVEDKNPLGRAWYERLMAEPTY
jgi:hypothetical protein